MLVGRDEELGAVTGQLSGPAAVAILGEAGIGKTALLRAACAEAGHEALEGGGLEMLSAVSYLPLARALGETPPPGDEVAIADFVLERVDGRTLVLDDLHWADPDTLALLPHLAGATPVLAGVRRGDPGTAEARAALDAAGFTTIELGPIGDDAARALILATGAELSEAEIEEVAAHAEGNPLLLEELAKGDVAEPTLRLSLTNRLRRLSEDAKRCAARGALLRRPARAELLGGGAEELLDAGLVVERADGLELRHALLADAIASGLDPERRREIHSSLAAELDDPGEAARHHQAAGEPDAAHNRAMDAAERATRPAERAEYLAIAAAGATGEDADLLRLRAASELNDAGRYGPARELLDLVEGTAPEILAGRALQEGLALVAQGHPDDAESSFQAGLELVGGTSGELEVRLLLASAFSLEQAEWASAAALERSRRAWELSSATGIARAEAEYVLGVALYCSAGFDEALEHLREALSLARRTKDHALEFKAGMTRGAVLAATGEVEEAAETMDGLAERARDENMRSWEVHARTLGLFLRTLNLCDYANGIAEMEELLRHPLTLGPQIDELRHGYGTALAETGRISEARDFLAGALEESVSDTGRSLLLGTLAETEWLAQRPGPALDAARRALAIETESPNVFFAELVECWALLESGGTPTPLTFETGFPIGIGGGLESEGVAHLAEPEGAAAAAESFMAAARAWAPVERRYELRCLWACGEARLRAGDLEGARAVLLEVESRAEAHGLMPLLGRIRASLRSAGVRRAAPRGSAPGGLSAREHEVMLLVAEGLSSADVAAQLGISRSTVESLIGSAMARLGAKTRRQAALRVIEEEDSR